MPLPAGGGILNVLPVKGEMLMLATTLVALHFALFGLVEAQRYAPHRLKPLNFGIQQNNKQQEDRQVTALFEAAARGNKTRLKSILQKKVNVNVQRPGGLTPLHYAAKCGSYDPAVITMLLQAGADINARDANGITPLLYSLREGGTQQLTEALLNGGADVNIADNGGWTPLLAATMVSSVPTISYVLDKGANIDSQTSDGRTALMITARKGDLHIVRLISSKGANAKLKNSEGKTALDMVEEELKKPEERVYASRKDLLEIVKLLKAN